MLQLEQAKLLQNRTSAFVSAIQNSDIEKLKELFTLEVNFRDTDFWRKLSKLDILKTNGKTIDYLMKLDIAVKPIPGGCFSSNIDFRRITGVKEDTPVHPVEMIKLFIRERLEKTLMYSEFTEETFKIAQKYFEKQKFFVLSQHAIKNFAGFKSIEGYDTVHSYIKENENYLVSILFNKIQSEENLEFFINNKRYKKFLENGIKIDSSETVMATAISDAALAKIKVLHDMGVNFPESKAHYSNLFQKSIDSSIPSQRYVIRNLKDITFNNQIVLKTLLHSSVLGKKENLINEVLERYSNECTSEQIAELIPEALRKREVNQEVLLVKKFLDYHLLKKDVEESSNEVERKKFKV